MLFNGLQSKRLPFKDAKLASSRLSAFSHSSWISEMQQASDRSIIISEILDSRTRNLVSVSRISDYVLSNELISMALASVAEDKQINRVLEELFAEEVLFHIPSLDLFYFIFFLRFKEHNNVFDNSNRSINLKWFSFLKNNFTFLERIEVANTIQPRKRASNVTQLIF